MKKIFRFLGVSVFLLALVGQSFAQTCEYVDGQVRYGFELKQLTAQEAQQALTDGYVDLWTYACFDQAFVDNGNILLNASHDAISQFRIAIGEATHSYKIVDKNGNDDKTGSVAMFARPLQNNCGSGRPAIYQDDIANDPNIIVSSSLAHTPIQNCCPTWAHGSSSRSGGFITRPSDVEDFCTIIEAEGKKWYCLKMYLVRFEYKQAQSFYVTFYSGSAADGVASNGASNFNVYANASFTQQLLWPGQTCGVGQDWSSSSYWGAIRGGVEVIADPEFSLAANATCNGSDLTGTFKVTDWASTKSWKDYRSVRMYVSAGGVRRDVSAQTAVSPSLPLGDASTASSFSYSLAPAAYLTAGVPADSLIWAIEDAKNNLI